MFSLPVHLKDFVLEAPLCLHLGPQNHTRDRFPKLASRQRFQLLLEHEELLITAAILPASGVHTRDVSGALIRQANAHSATVPQPLALCGF